MASITDFSTWLASVDTEDHDEIYAMFTAIRDVAEVGSFACTAKKTQNGNQYLVKCSYSADTLLLTSGAAKTTFLNKLQRQYAGPEWTMETWYDFKCEMAKEE